MQSLGSLYSVAGLVPWFTERKHRQRQRVAETAIWSVARKRDGTDSDREWWEAVERHRQRQREVGGGGEAETAAWKGEMRRDGTGSDSEWWEATGSDKERGEARGRHRQRQQEVGGKGKA